MPALDWSELVRTKGYCQACNLPMKYSKNYNFIQHNKKATWKFPVWDNMMLKPGVERINRAMSLVCDRCLKLQVPVTDALEFGPGRIIRHKLSELEDAFVITTDMLNFTPRPVTFTTAELGPDSQDKFKT